MPFWSLFFFFFWLFLATLSHSMRRLPCTRGWSTGILFSIWDQSVRMASSRSSWRRFLEVWRALLIVFCHKLLTFPFRWHGEMLIFVKSIGISLVLRKGVLCVMFTYGKISNWECNWNVLYQTAQTSLENLPQSYLWVSDVTLIDVFGPTPPIWRLYIDYPESWK